MPLSDTAFIVADRKRLSLESNFWLKYKKIITTFMMADRAKVNTHSWKAQQLKTTPIKFRTAAKGQSRFGWPGNRLPPVLMLRSLSYLVHQI